MKYMYSSTGTVVLDTKKSDEKHKFHQLLPSYHLLIYMFALFDNFTLARILCYNTRNLILISLRYADCYLALT